MGLTMWHAAEAERVGDKIIPRDFPLLAESGTRIEYVFRSDATKSGGKICLGKCRKVGGLNAILSAEGGIPEEPTEPKDMAYLVVEVAYDMWRRMEPAQQEALVFHELCHAVVEKGEEEDDVWTLRLRAHDVEAFADEVRIYGLWKSDLTFFVETAGESLQLSFENHPVPA